MFNADALGMELIANMTWLKFRPTWGDALLLTFRKMTENSRKQLVKYIGSSTRQHNKNPLQDSSMVFI
jgi:hypothetical protein